MYTHIYTSILCECWLTTREISPFTDQFLPPVEHVLQSRLQLVRKDGVLIIQLWQNRRRCKYAQQKYSGRAVTRGRAALILPVVVGGCCRGRPPGPTGSGKERMMSFPAVSKVPTVHVLGLSHLFYGQLFESRQGTGEEAHDEGGGGADNI